VSPRRRSLPCPWHGRRGWNLLDLDRHAFRLRQEGQV